MPQIGFPDWTKATIQPAYSIKLDNTYYISSVTSLTLTANTETQIDQFSFTTTLPHVEWGIWFFGYVSAAATTTFNTYIDGALIDTNSYSLSTSSTGQSTQILDAGFINNKPTGTHTLKFTVTASASITLNISHLDYGVGTIVTPNKSTAPTYIFNTLLNNQIYYIKASAIVIPNYIAASPTPLIEITSGNNTSFPIVTLQPSSSTTYNTVTTLTQSAQLFTNYFNTDSSTASFAIVRSNTSTSYFAVMVLQELQIAESNLLIFNYPTSTVITQ